MARKKRKNKIGNKPETTARYKQRFLAKLELGNAAAGAAKLAGVARSTVFGWKKNDPEFALAWEDSVHAAVDKVETSLMRRAIKNSDTAAIAILKAYRPERYDRKAWNEARTPSERRISLQEHFKQLERLGLPVPLLESDYDDEIVDAAPGPAATDT